MIDDLEGIWTETAEVKFKIPPHDSPGGAEEISEKSPSGRSLFRSGDEPETSE